MNSRVVPLVIQVTGLLIVAWQPFAGGPRAPSAVLAGLGVWLCWRSRSIFNATPNRRILLVFALLIIPIAFSIPASYAPKDSLSILAALLVYIFAAMALLVGLQPRDAHARMNLGLALIAIFWIGYSGVQYLVGGDILPVPLNNEGRVVGLFTDNLRQANLLAVLLPVLVVWLGRRHLGWAALGALACLSVIGLSGTRGAWVMGLVASTVLLSAVRLRLGLPLLLAIVGASVALLTTSAIVSQKAEQSFSISQLSFEGVDALLSHRLYLWDTAVNMITARPVFGVGAGAYYEAYSEYAGRPDDPFRDWPAAGEKAYHAHQMYLSIGAETGLVGLAAFLAVGVLCINWYRKAPAAARARARPYAYGLLAVAFPINSQPVLFTPWWFPAMLLLLCLMLAALHTRPEDHGHAMDGSADSENRSDPPGTVSPYD